MAEEFEESDLIFDQNSEGEVGDYRRVHSNFNSREFRNRIRSKRKKSNNKRRNSVPVNIPENATTRNPWLQYVESDFFEDEYEEEDQSGEIEIVPPHVITGRRMAGKMAFSVCTGNGRTLKGRDLSEVRNSILRMTGFLEP